MKGAFSPGERLPANLLSDPFRAIPDLRAAWEAYQETGVTGGALRPAIVNSWMRSKQYSVSPDRRAADLVTGALSGFESHDQLRRLILQAWRPTKTQLADELSGSDSAVVICDDGGKILDRGGDASILRMTEAQNFVPGSVWSEAGAGTNGIGLALALRRPAQVFSAEHFCVGFQGYACTAAPVRHPVTREVIGVLDVTTRATDINPHTFAMIVHAARDMEREMEDHVFGRERELLERYLRGRVGLQVPFFTVDRSGRTLIQNAAAAQTLGAEDLPAVLLLVRESLRTGRDFECDLELTAGRAEISCHIVRPDDEVIGALVSVRPVRSDRPATPAPGVPAWQPLLGGTAAMRDLFARAERVAERCANVVIEGEPGTGKLTLAKAIHARSSRREEPLALVNFARRGWREELRDAEDSAVLVLLRLSALSDAQQLEVAAVVEQLHEVGVWTLTTVTRGDRQIRLELLHRLGPATLFVPPLRERLGDVDLIVSDWCRREGVRGHNRPMLSPSAMDALRRHEWPGNVRELLNTLDAACLQRPARVIGADELSVADHGPRSGVLRSGALRDVEREAIEQALARTGGNISRASELLGISRSTLHRRLHDYRLLGR